MIDHRTFADPGPEFRDVTLWMLNDRLEDDELVRQLEGIRAAGCGAVIARTFNGLRSDYPGEGFMASMETLIAAAGRLGLRVYLQAGFMPACVPNLPEEFCLPVLTARPKGVAADTPPARGMRQRLHPCGTLRGPARPAEPGGGGLLPGPGL